MRAGENETTRIWTADLCFHLPIGQPILGTYCGWIKSCATLKPWETIVVDVSRGIIIQGFLRWFRNSSIHSLVRLHRCPFWWFCRKIDGPGLPGDFINYQGTPSISSKRTAMKHRMTRICWSRRSSWSRSGRPRSPRSRPPRRASGRPQRNDGLWTASWVFSFQTPSGPARKTPGIEALWCRASELRRFFEGCG